MKTGLGLLNGTEFLGFHREENGTPVAVISVSCE